MRPWRRRWLIQVLAAVPILDATEEAIAAAALRLVRAAAPGR